MGIKGIHRTLHPFLGPLPCLHHWGIGKQAHEGIVGLSFALGGKHRHIHLHSGSIAIGICPAHGYCQHKSSFHVCIDGIQVAALVSRHPSPPPASHSPCSGSYPAASQGCAVIVHGTSRHVYYAILNLFFLTFLFFLLFHGQDTHFHVPLVHLHIECRALVLLHPYVVNRTIHTHPVVAQFRIHGNLHCCAQSTEIVRAKRRVSQHLASSLLLQLDPAFGTLPDLCLPVLHAIQDGRHLHLLAWTVYASVRINGHARLLLGRRRIVLITVIVCNFRQATVRTQDNTHGISYRVLLLAFYHRSFGNRFACACIHHSGTNLFAGHIRNKVLQGRYHEVFLQLLGFLPQACICLATELHYIAPRLGGSDKRVLFQQLATAVQQTPLHLLHVDRVLYGQFQGVSGIVDFCHVHPQLRSSVTYGVADIPNTFLFCLHLGRLPVAMSHIEVYQFLFAHHRVHRNPIVCRLPYHIEHVATVHLLVLATLHHGQPVLGGSVVQEFRFRQGLTEEFQTSAAPRPRSIGIGTHGIQLAQRCRIHGSGSSALAFPHLLQQLEVILYAIRGIGLPQQPLFQNLGKFVLACTHCHGHEQCHGKENCTYQSIHLAINNCYKHKVKQISHTFQQNHLIIDLIHSFFLLF